MLLRPALLVALDPLPFPLPFPLPSFAMLHGHEASHRIDAMRCDGDDDRYEKIYARAHGGRGHGMALDQGTPRRRARWGAEVPTDDSSAKIAQRPWTRLVIGGSENCAMVVANCATPKVLVAVEITSFTPQFIVPLLNHGYRHVSGEQRLAKISRTVIHGDGPRR